MSQTQSNAIRDSKKNAAPSRDRLQMEPATPLWSAGQPQERSATQARWGVWSLNDGVVDVIGDPEPGLRESDESATPPVSLGDDTEVQWSAERQTPIYSAAEDYAWTDEELDQMQRQEDEANGIFPAEKTIGVVREPAPLERPEASRSGWGEKKDQGRSGAVDETAEASAGGCFGVDVEQNGAPSWLSEEALAQRARDRAQRQADAAGLRLVENPGPETLLGPQDFVLFTPKLDEVATAAGPMGSSNRPLAMGALQTHEAWAAMPQALRFAADPHSMSLGLWLAQARARASEAGCAAIVFTGIDNAQEEARGALRTAIASMREEEAREFNVNSGAEAPEPINPPRATAATTRAWVAMAGNEDSLLREPNAF